jgi:hypothetical protein
LRGFALGVLGGGKPQRAITNSRTPSGAILTKGAMRSRNTAGSTGLVTSQIADCTREGADFLLWALDAVEIAHGLELATAPRFIKRTHLSARIVRTSAIV